MTNLRGFILLSIVKDKEGNPHSIDIFQSKRILWSRLLQVEVFNPVIVPDNNSKSFVSFFFGSLPFKNQSELESVDVVDFLDLDHVNDRHWHIDVDRDIDILLFVKAERSNLLVVVVLHI